MTTDLYLRALIKRLAGSASKAFYACCRYRRVAEFHGEALALPRLLPVYAIPILPKAPP